MLHRIACGLSYDGAKYHGWQTQESLATIQQTVEQALSQVADHPVRVMCAGRTDAGVHATGQVIHFDTSVFRNSRAWVFGGNRYLPPDISFLWAKPVVNEFHARYSATARRYRYVIYNSEVRSGILKNAVTWLYRPLDAEKMRISAQCLLGEHDFSSFRGAGCQSKHPIRKILYIDVFRIGQMVIVEIEANAFLLHMVRNIVGALVEVGMGEKPVDWISFVLKAKDRRESAATLFPHGLYLINVTYPKDFDLPQQPIGPFFLP